MEIPANYSHCIQFRPPIGIARYKVIVAEFPMRPIGELFTKGRQYKTNIPTSLLDFSLFRNHTEREDLIYLKSILTARVSFEEYFAISRIGKVEGIALTPWAADIFKILSKTDGDIVLKLYRNGLISHVIFTEGKQILLDTGRWLNRKSKTRKYPHFIENSKWGYEIIGSMS